MTDTTNIPDIKCVLCNEGVIPEPSPDMTVRDHAYLFGFADGAVAALRGQMPKLCESHQKRMGEALGARGIQMELKPTEAAT